MMIYTRVCLLILCVTINACIAAILVTMTPLFLKTVLNSSYIAISVLLALGTLMSALATHYIAKFSDKPAWRYNVALLSAGAGFIGFGLLYFAQNYMQFALLYISFIAIAGSLFSQFMALNFILAEEYLPMVRAFASLGWVIGPPIGGGIIAITSYQNLFLILAGLYVVLIGIIFTLQTTAPLPPSTVNTTHTSPETNARSTKIMGLVITLITIHALMSFPTFGLPLIMLQQGGTAYHVGLAFGIAAAIEIPLILCINKIRTWIKAETIFTCCGMIFTLYYVVLAFLPSYVIIIALGVLHGIVTGLTMGLGLILIQNKMPDTPGRASAIYANILRLTHMGTLLVAGLIAEFFTLQALFITCAILATGFVASYFFIIFNKKTIFNKV